MPTALQLAPFIPVSQGHTLLKPWWHSTLCCGLFDLALAAYIANDVKYTNITICRQVDVLLEYATTPQDGVEGTFSNVGEFFDMARMLEFVEFIIEKSKTDPRLALFKDFEASLVFWDDGVGLSSVLSDRKDTDYIVFPYEPAYQNSEAKFREDNGYHFLHFGLILPGISRFGKYKILQSARGRTVKKPVYNPFRLYHTAGLVDLNIANQKTKDKGYKWFLQFPWRKYKGVKAPGFTKDTPPKFSKYDVLNQALRLTKKG